MLPGLVPGSKQTRAWAKIQTCGQYFGRVGVDHKLVVYATSLWLWPQARGKVRRAAWAGARQLRRTAWAGARQLRRTAWAGARQRMDDRVGNILDVWALLWARGVRPQACRDDAMRVAMRVAMPLPSNIPRAVPHGHLTC